MKKIISLCLAIMIVACLGVTAFATTGSTGGASGFVSALTDSNTGITGENLWTALIPFVGLFVAIFIFAFAYSRVRKTTGSGSKGKFRM